MGILWFLCGIFAVYAYQQLSGIVTHKTLPQTNKVVIHEHAGDEHLRSTHYTKDLRQVTGFKRSNNGRLEYTAVYA